METDTYTTQDVINAECTLAPIACDHCGDKKEVTYNQAIGDAYCAACGTWQNGD